MMLKNSQKIAVELFLLDYNPKMSFKALCQEIADDDSDDVCVWNALESVRGRDLANLIQEVELAISKAMER